MFNIEFKLPFSHKKERYKNLSCVYYWSSLKVSFSFSYLLFFERKCVKLIKLIFTVSKYYFRNLQYFYLKVKHFHNNWSYIIPMIDIYKQIQICQICLNTVFNIKKNQTNFLPKHKKIDIKKNNTFSKLSFPLNRMPIFRNTAVCCYCISANYIQIYN